MSVAGASPAAGGLGLEPPRARGGASGGIFAYWFGTSSLRADPSEVFAGLVYRLRARDAAFAPHELALLKQCETDVQVRAVTAGYVTGAGTHSALGFVSQRAPRLMLSALAGACGAYAGVQSMARDCMRRVARLEDSRLAADARFVIRQVAPHDPLGREPAEHLVPGAVRRRAPDASEDGAPGDGGDVRETLRDVRGDEEMSRDVARIDMEETRATASSARATETRSAYGDDGDDARFFADDATRSGNAASTRTRDSRRPNVGPARNARRDATRRDATRANDGANDVFRKTPFPLSPRSGASFIIPRDAFGEGVPDGIEPGTTSAAKRVPHPPRGGARSRAEAREARRRASREAAGARRRDARNAGDETEHRTTSTLLETPARDELIDPAARASFSRGTRRTAYGDVLDR